MANVVNEVYVPDGNGGFKLMPIPDKSKMYALISDPQGIRWTEVGGFDCP